jgi:hypothetical protein
MNGEKSDVPSLVYVKKRQLEEDEIVEKKREFEYDPNLPKI